MILISFLKWLEENGYGVIDESLFLDESPIDENGEAIDGLSVRRLGGEYNKYRRSVDAEIFVRHSNKFKALEIAEKLFDELKRAYGEVCELPEATEYHNFRFTNVEILLTGNIENVGQDDAGKYLLVLPVRIKFNKENIINE